MTHDILQFARFGTPYIPLFALRPIFSHLIDSLTKRHPNLFERLGSYGGKRFLIDPVDFPFTLLLCPNGAHPELTPHRRDSPPEHDAGITGPIEKFVDLVNGVEDGDALFFSRDLRIEGDTEAVLALRNAVDDLEIDLVEEIESMLGPLAASARFAKKRVEDAGLLFGGLKTVLSETLISKTIDRSKCQQKIPVSGEEL